VRRRASPGSVTSSAGGSWNVRSKTKLCTRPLALQLKNALYGERRVPEAHARVVSGAGNDMFSTDMIQHGHAPHALVAQLDRASDFESEGREFESLRARQQNQSLIEF
jgi:hypothetical protein